MYDINTLQRFAQLKPYTMSEQERAFYLLNMAADFDVTPNALVNMFRDARDVLREQSDAFLSKLDNALLQALVEVALFNSRRCYHTWLAIR